MSSRKPLGRRVLANLRIKWVQVVISLLVFTLAVLGSYKLLVKGLPTSEAEKKKAEKEFKFMHCDKCMKEMPYNPDLAGKKAGGCKCPSGETGFWEPTKETVAGGGDPQLRWFYTAVLVESVLWLATLWFLLARSDATPDAYYVRCLHCQAVLQFTRNEFDSLIECPNCEQPVRLPDEDEAMTGEDHQDQYTDATLDVYKERLRAGGYVFPDERPEPEDEQVVEESVAGEQPAANTPDGTQ